MQDGYLGVIQALGFVFAPLNWAFCAGQIIAISQQNALYSLLGCNFGGDCRVSFGYPDLRGRTPIGQGQGPGLTNRVIGQQTGVENLTLATSQMPAHTHTHSYTGSGGGQGADATVQVATVAGKNATASPGDYLAAPATTAGLVNLRAFIAPADIPAGSTATIGGVSGGGAGGGFVNDQFTIDVTGGSDSVYIMQPSLTINYCLCTNGHYPTRS